MSLDTFHPFSRLPRELQIEIWRFACAGNMRLALLGVICRHHDSRSRGYIVEAEWRAHVKRVQNYRISLLHTCQLSRSTSLDRFDLMKCVGFQPPSCGPGQYCQYDTSQPNAQRTVVVDWETDLVHRYQDSFLPPTKRFWNLVAPAMTPAHKITRYAVNLHEYHGPIVLLEMSELELEKVATRLLLQNTPLHIFTSLRELIVVTNPFKGAIALLCRAKNWTVQPSFSVDEFQFTHYKDFFAWVELVGRQYGSDLHIELWGQARLHEAVRKAFAAVNAACRFQVVVDTSLILGIRAT